MAKIKKNCAKIKSNFERAVNFFTLQQYEEAIATFEQELEIKKNNSQIWLVYFYIAESYLNLSQYKICIPYYLKVLKLKPILENCVKMSIYIGLGLAYFANPSSNEFSESVEFLTKAIEIYDSDQTVSLHQIKFAYRVLGTIYEKARKDCDRALEIYRKGWELGSTPLFSRWLLLDLNTCYNRHARTSMADDYKVTNIITIKTVKRGLHEISYKIYGRDDDAEELAVVYEGSQILSIDSIFNEWLLQLFKIFGLSNINSGIFGYAKIIYGIINELLDSLVSVHTYMPQWFCKFVKDICIEEIQADKNDLSKCCNQLLNLNKQLDGIKFRHFFSKNKRLSLQNKINDISLKISEYERNIKKNEDILNFIDLKTDCILRDENENIDIEWEMNSFLSDFYQDVDNDIYEKGLKLSTTHSENKTNDNYDITNEKFNSVNANLISHKKYADGVSMVGKRGGIRGGGPPRMTYRNMKYWAGMKTRNPKTGRFYGGRKKF